MQSDYLAFQALSQHVAKMVQSHPQVPLQTLIVSHSNFIFFAGLLTVCSSIFWYLIKDFLLISVPVANECFRRRAMCLQLGDYGFLDQRSISLIQTLGASRTGVPRIIQMDIGNRVMLHVCIAEGECLWMASIV